ncbi:MAG: sigma-54-dependent Fis family transcriptional regulator [Calditrichaeota bacterium]|nr:sigma-54-dependent Fis family transcriptional regulator [Calditrichota bacterium]
MDTPKPVTIVTHNRHIREIISLIDRITHSDSSVLLVGETGVGKEIFADYIHKTSHRKDKPFVKVSLSALPPELLESELFGHEKGAFTSAHSEKKGLFEIANSGSIFLDDIDDVPMPIQSKLLRVLESKELMRVGGTQSIPVNVRLITASKVDLKIMIEKNLFRSDLFYRINVVPLDIPPLRERKDDIPVLFEYFVNRYASEKLKISVSAMQSLISYSWPGNIRELRNVAQRVSLFADKEVKIKDLPVEVRQIKGLDSLLKACDRCFIEGTMSFDQVVNCLEMNLLNQALTESKFNQSQAAKKLGLSLSTFRDKLKKYKLLTTSQNGSAEIRK